MNFGPIVNHKSQPLKNRALCDPYEPGSIFKPIAAAIGIDCGAFSPNAVFYCEGGYFAKYRIGEFLNKPFGNLSVTKIIAKSSNVGMAKMGLAMGDKKLHAGVKLFGFGQKTGIDLPGEDAGLFYPLSRWSGWSKTRIPFGHEISVTSIQIIRAYCILANGGRPVRPHLIKAIVAQDGKILQLKQPTPLIGQVIKPETADWMVKHVLTAVVNEGTAKSAQIEGLQTFGKTGTANIARPAAQGGGYDKSNYIASFVGGAPAEKPELVVLVAIRKPNRSLGIGYSGGRVAAPAFKVIVEKTFNYLHPGQIPTEDESSI